MRIALTEFCCALTIVATGVAGCDTSERSCRVASLSSANPMYRLGVPTEVSRLHIARTLEAAAAALQTKPIAIVICESNLLPGSWKDLLKHVSAHPQPPLLIVTSRLADEYLWSEALHHGAYDVLGKLFDPDELTRVLTLASLKWSHPHKGR